MTEIDRAELRRLAVSAGDTWQGTIGVAPKDVLTLLDALDEAERERDKASAEVARQQALRVENGKRFEQMRSERTAAIDRAEAAEAAVERVRATVEAERHYTEECGWDVPVIRILAALAPVTEEGDKE